MLDMSLVQNRRENDVNPQNGVISENCTLMQLAGSERKRMRYCSCTDFPDVPILMLGLCLLFNCFVVQ